MAAATMTEQRLTRLNILGFAAFNLAYLAVKLATVSAAHYDFAKEIYNAQSLRWVYEAANPPLYTWLLYGLTRIIGPGVEGPLILGHVLLFAVLLAAFALGRRLLGTAADGALAAWLLLTLHQIFRFQFARTHSLLLVPFVLVALLAFVEVMRTGRWRDYGLLGLALGAGLLSKYVFAGFIGALVLGALATRGGRRALGSRRLLLTIAAMLAVILPVALAGADQWSALAEIFRMRTTQSTPPAGLVARLATVLDLVSQIVVFALVPLLAMGAAIAAGILFRSTDPATDQNTRADDDMLRLLVAVVLAGIAIVFVGVLAGVVERVSGRFLLAFLLPLPFVIVAVARRTSPVRAGLRCGGIAIALVLLAQAGVRIIDLTPYCSRKCTDLAPYEGLAARLREAGFTHGAVTATEVSVAGNIVAALPGSVVTVRNVRRIARPVLPSRPRCLLIWRKRDAKSAQPPLTLINASGLAPADAESRVRVIDVPWRWASRDRFRPFAPGTRRVSSWGTILLRRGEGSCR